MNWLVFIATSCTAVQTALGWNLTFSPARVYQLPMGSSLNVSVNATAWGIVDTSQLMLSLNNSDASIVRVTNSSMVLEGYCSAGDQCLLQGVFTLQGVFLGFSSLDIQTTDLLQTHTLHSGYSVSVINTPAPINDVFNILVITIICIINFSFGCAFDLDTAKQVVKAPLAPFIGFLGQYGIMPAVSILISTYNFIFKVINFNFPYNFHMHILVRFK